MARTEIATIKCPTCHNDLPAWSQKCQFCGTPLQGVARPMGAPVVDTWNDRPTWQEVGYIVCSVVFILLGALSLLQGFKVIQIGPDPISAGEGAYLQFTGAISAVLGIAMLFQQLWAQFIVKWYSVLSFVASLFNALIATSMASTMARVVPTRTVVLIVSMHVGFAVFYAFTIYIIKVVGDVDP